MLPREAARSFNSFDFVLNWERESAPADYCLKIRLFMDCSCPSLPSNLMTADRVTPNEQTSVAMAANRCHFTVRCLYVFVVSIEKLSFTSRNDHARELTCIRQDHSTCQAVS